MAWELTPFLLERYLEEHFRGATPPDPSKFFVLLTNASTYTDTSDLATVVQQEVPAINGYTRQPYNPAAGAYDKIQRRYELPSVVATYTASADGFIQFDRSVLVSNASATASKTFSADPATNRLTVTGHGLANGDRVVPTPDAGATLPGGMAAQAYYVRVLDANTVELYLEPALATILDFTTAGSGTLRLRYAQGNVEAFAVFGSQLIPASATQSISCYMNMAKAGADPDAA